MFLRIKTVKGRRYLYAEKRYREGGKVRSISRSLGPVERANYEQGWKVIEKLMAEYPTDQFGNRVSASPPAPAQPSSQSQTNVPSAASPEPIPPSDQE